MAIANGAQHSIHYIAEATYGTTPSTPTWIPLPHTGTSLSLSKDAIESEKLRGDRQVEDFRHGNKSISGDISSELEYAAFDDILEAVLCGTWATDVLKAGVTRRSFTVERKFADLTTPEYHRYTGCEFNTLSLSVSPNSMVGATFGVIGKDLVLATAAVASSTYSADVGNSPFDSFTGSISEGGSTIGTVTSIDITIENGLEPLFSVGSSTTNRPSIGKSRATGSLTTYFESKTLYEKFINETSSAITLTLTDVAGNSYEIDMSTVKYNSGSPDVSGEGSVTISMDFVALFNGSDSSQIVITRADV
tara:strand:+ start:8887 stop:9804 length:918 start_codon:yes stop_codon:yes gene_type:complete